MKPEEIIKNLELLKAEIEWDKSIEYQIVIDEAIKIIKASEKGNCRAEVQEFFEKVWALYPNKKGKGQVSDAKKRKLFKYGYEQIARAIKRYEADLLKDSWRKPQNGSTFFNGGFIDYLDENAEYEPTTDIETERKVVDY